MTSIIHVDPHELRQAAHSISEMAESLSSIADKLLFVTLGPRIYSGQLRGLTTNTGYELRGLAKKRVIRLREISALLIQLADGFEAVDQARLDGFVHIAGAMAAVAQESLVVPAIPVWLRRGACPPWIDEFFWEHEFTEEERLRILKSGEEYWAYLLRHSADMGGMDQEVLEEMLVILLLAHLGFDVNGRVATTPMLEGEYGIGKIGVWIEFNVNPNDPKAAQYLNIYKLFGEHRGYGVGFPTGHYNLCGQLAVMAAVGEGILADGLSKFKDMKTWQCYEFASDGKCLKAHHSGDPILKNSSEGTTGYTLSQFFKEYGWSSEPASGELSANEMAEVLREGKTVVALVNIEGLNDPNNPMQHGQLMGLDDSDADVAHWVTVLDVIELPDDKAYVRVYNPFNNQEEIYSWSTFTDSWAETPGNSNEYGYMVAAPPESGTS